MKTVVVIGGGASGLMSAYFAGKNGNNVILVEKNEKLGKKIYITGKGRCNFTNDCMPVDFLENVVHGKKFLTGALYSFSPNDCISFFEEFGLSTKTERGNRVFPLSDHASDVTKTLEKTCKTVGVRVLLNETAVSLSTTMQDVDIMPRIVAVQTDKRVIPCDCAIVATGGVSYPSTGSTGDGYQFAKSFNMRCVEQKPALCGINLQEIDSKLQGLSLKNVSLKAEKKGKMIYDGFGEMLFTHYGISGPIVLTLSSLICRENLSEISLFLDLKPALDEQTLDKRLLRLFETYKNKKLFNVALELLPSDLVRSVLSIANLSPDKQVNSVTKEERKRLLTALKAYKMTPVSLRDFSEAIITSGGVDLSEIDPKTMSSKKINGLKFCGEVLDVDAFTGGFNLQIAFSTGYLAGKTV